MSLCVHLGGNVSVYRDDIIGIFDLERTSVEKSVNDFLAKEQKGGRIYYCSFDMPKSFVVTSQRTYVTNVSVLTLKARGNSVNNL